MPNDKTLKDDAGNTVKGYVILVLGCVGVAALIVSFSQGDPKSIDNAILGVMGVGFICKCVYGIAELADKKHSQEGGDGNG